MLSIISSVIDFLLNGHRVTSFAINDGYVRLIELGIGWSHFVMNREEYSDDAGHDEEVWHLFNC
ncbi:hypothetical protein DT075_13125 [Bacillus licheniformis]|nr:hypothetical protein DT075_13125 [Bacillus licheniformis]